MKKVRKEGPEEIEAARIVATHLGGTAELHDQEGNLLYNYKIRFAEGNLLYNYKIRFADGRFDALEVTRSLDQALMDLRGQMGHFKEEKVGEEAAMEKPAFRTPRLKWAWHLWTIGIEPDYREFARRVETQAVPIIAMLKARGVNWFHRSMLRVEDRELAALGIAFGGADERASGRVYILPPAQSGAIGPSSVVDAGLAEIPKNLHKISLAYDAERRHVFVWIFRDLLSSVFTQELPESTPELPEPVTDLWVAARPNGVNHVWRFERGGVWKRYLPVAM